MHNDDGDQGRQVKIYSHHGVMHIIEDKVSNEFGMLQVTYTMAETRVNHEVDTHQCRHSSFSLEVPLGATWCNVLNYGK